MTTATSTRYGSLFHVNRSIITDDRSSTVKVPKVLWAQRSDIVYVTIEVVEAQDEHYELTKTSLTYSAIQGNTGEKYAVELPFYAEIDEVASQHHKTDRCTTFTLKKSDTEQPYWPRLLKSGKPHYVHTDFGRWKDEDEEDEAASSFGGMGDMGGMGGMDFSQFANMAGSGGFPMGGEDDDEDAADYEAEGHGDEDEEAHEHEEDPYQKTSKAALESDD